METAYSTQQTYQRPDNKKSKKNNPTIKDPSYLELLRVSDVLSLVSVSRSSWWSGVKSGRFPAPLKLGPRTTVWRRDDIKKLIADGAEEVRHAA